jgi:hypothetical protein
MKVINMFEHISKGKNLLFYNKSVEKCYDNLKSEYLCVYFNEPTPIKMKLIRIIKKISPHYKRSLDYLTILNLRDILIKELKSDNLIILFNNFDLLTKRTVQIYEYLNSLSNIQFVCSFSQKFKAEIYPFFKDFVLINKEEYKQKSKNEINVTYPLYIAISIISFIIYIKIASSVYSAIVIIGGIWFAFLMFRTLVYIGGKV